MNDEPETVVPPSQQGAQGPVPKPGEPVKHVKGIMAELTPAQQKAAREEKEPAKPTSANDPPKMSQAQPRRRI